MDLTTLTRDQLREYAASQGIGVEGVTRKSELLALIQQSEQSTEPSPEPPPEPQPEPPPQSG